MAPVQLDLATLGSETNFWFALSTSLGSSSYPGNLDEFLAETAGWYQPRLIVLTGAAEKVSMAAILEQARRVADVTRDCRSPLRFVWLHEATQAITEPEIPYEVWPPQWRDIPQMDFTGNLDTVLYRAFRLYLDRRVYWEAAGQGERVYALAEWVLARGLSYNSSRRLDEVLDQVLDTTSILDEERHCVADCLADPNHQETLIAALQQKSFPPADPRTTHLWHAAGILWRPPGISRWHITPMSVRILIENPDHVLSRRLGAEVLKRRIAQARVNTQVSQMALILTTQVEAELLDALHRTSWETLLTQCGLIDDLTKYQAQVGTDGCLLDYASFGQLVRLAKAAGNAFEFPLSRERLKQIVNVRNAAAHGHPVRWEGLRVVVEALVSLGT